MRRLVFATKMKSKYPGKCYRCGLPIKVGDYIDWSRGQPTTHWNCPISDEELRRKDEEEEFKKTHGRNWYEPPKREAPRPQSKPVQMISKYPGKCPKCGKPFPAGTEILYSKSEGASHVMCPTPSPQTPDPNKISLSRGEGYGGRPYMVGQTLRLQDGSVVTVVKTGESYYREDGLSFGVGDESGHVYWADARPAKAEEIAELEVREGVRKSKQDMMKAIQALVKHIRAKGEHPWGPPSSTFPQGTPLNSRNFKPVKQELPFKKGGSGGWFEDFMTDGNWLYHLRYNGADGDDWRPNNIDSIAIGLRVKMDDTVKRMMIDAGLEVPK